jgi:hypothetical protein
MKYSAALLLAVASVNASITERQAATIIGVVNKINTVVGSLDTAIKGFSGDPKPFLAASQEAHDTVSKGVETVKGASSITITDSVQIQGQVSNLQATIESVVSDLIAKKDALVSAGQGQTIYKNLQDQLSGAKALQAAITSKVPPEVAGIAASLSTGINAALEKGVASFKDTPGAASGSASTSTSSSGSAPAAPASGSSPAAPASGSSGFTGASIPAAPASGSSGFTGTSTGSHSGSSAGAAGAAARNSSSTAAPKPAIYTGAAPRTVAGSFAGFVAMLAVVFAL